MIAQKLGIALENFARICQIALAFMPRVFVILLLILNTCIFAAERKCSQRLLPNEWTPKELEDGFHAIVKVHTPLFFTYLANAKDPVAEDALQKAVPNRETTLRRLLHALCRRHENLANAGIFYGVFFQELEIKRFKGAELRTALLEVLNDSLQNHPKLKREELIEDDFPLIKQFTQNRLGEALSGPRFWAFLKVEFGGIEQAKKALKAHNPLMYQNWRSQTYTPVPARTYLPSELQNPLLNKQQTVDFILSLKKNGFPLSKNKPPTVYKNPWLHELSFLYLGVRVNHSDLEIASIAHFGGWPQMMGEIFGTEERKTKHAPAIEKPEKRKRPVQEGANQIAIYKKLEKKLAKLAPELREKAEQLIFHISQSPDILSEGEVLFYLVQDPEYGLTENEAKKILALLKSN